MAKLEDQVTAQEGALQSAKQAAETIQAAAAEEKDKTAAAHEAAMAEAATQHRVAAAQLTAALAAAAVRFYPIALAWKQSCPGPISLQI